MKRITIILSLIAMMLGSAISYADDVNIFLRNRWDNQIDQSDSKKSQVLFLIDVIAEGEPVCETEYTCYEINDDLSRGEELDCSAVDDNNDGDGSCGAGCMDASLGYFVPNNNYIAYTGGIALDFDGCLCPNDSGGSSGQPGYYKVRNCAASGIDVRPVIQKVMQQRPDVKYGVMALASDKTAHMILDVESRNLEGDQDPTKDDSIVQAALYGSFPMLKHPESSDTAVFPTLGGMQLVESYLKGNLTGHPSPLTDDCKYTQLIVITNGGWKNDVEADSSASLTALTQRLAENTVKPSCTAQVATSVIGINVPENNSADYPLFEGATPVASIMAANGQGIYENVKPNAGETDPVEINKQIGTGILNSVLGIIDFSYDQPSALITPVAPVSISRGRNLNVLFGSAFKAKGEPSWPGNITKAESGAIPQSDFDSSFFSFPSDRTTRKIKTICGQQLCDLDKNLDDDFTAEDLDWLQGIGISEDTDVLGDVVHFRPLPIHYGNANGDQNDIGSNEIYVVVGTNRGLLHLFDYSGNEQWAFLPPQLKPMVSALRQGYIAPAYNMVNHFYGVDGAPSVFIYDDDKDGLINDGDDRVLLYYGLRRGGAGYFAMDITTPTAASLLWQIGGSDLDYGDKPESEIAGGAKSEKEEQVDPRSGSGGGCPMFGGASESFGSASAVTKYCGTESGTNLYCLEPSGNSEPAWNFASGIGPVQSGALNFGYGYFAGLCGQCDVSGNPVCVEKCAGQSSGTPVFTIVNQCIPDINFPQTEVTFDAHVGAQFTYSVDPSIGAVCYVAAGLQGVVGTGDNELTALVGVGKWSGQYDDLEMVVGFDISGLPEDITIESAQITFGHHGDKDIDPDTVYDTDEIYVYASDKGFWGNDPKPDGYDSNFQSLAASDDCRDTGYFQTGIADNKIARIQKPSSYIRGSRTTDGVFLSSLSQEDREAKLTELFTDCWSGSGSEKPCLHDMTANRNNRWVQFKVKRDGSSSGRVTWGRAIEGPQVANQEGDDYWDKTAPKLHLKWRYNTLTAPELTIQKIGNFGAVTAVKSSDSSTFNCPETDAECANTYAAGDEVVLTASGSDFAGWTDCPSESENQCTVIMDANKTVIANYNSTNPALTLDIQGGTGSVTVNYVLSPLEQTIEYDTDDSLPASILIPAGAQVKLTPSPVDSFDKWVIGTSVTCNDTTKVCTFTMPSGAVTAEATFNSGSAATCSNSEDATNADHVADSRATLASEDDKNCSSCTNDACCIGYGAEAYYEPWFGDKYCSYSGTNAFGFPTTEQHNCVTDPNSYAASGSGSWNGLPTESVTLFENENNNKWYTDQNTCKSAQ